MKHSKHSNSEAKVILFPSRDEIRADSERNNLRQLQARLAMVPEAPKQEPERLIMPHLQDDKATNWAILALMATIVIYGMIICFMVTVNSDRPCMPPVNETPGNLSL